MIAGEEAVESLRCIGPDEMAQFCESFFAEHGVSPAGLSAFRCETAQTFPDEFGQSYMELREKLDFEERMLESAPTDKL